MSNPNWRDLPSLSALRALDATARHAGFSGAARSLNVTPAAVAQQVRGLEAELGAALVRREGRGVVLTPQGAALAASLAAGFEAIAGGVAALREDQARRGIRVTTTPSIVDEFLLRRMGGFWRLHPDIEVSLLPSASYIDLASEGFDLGIRGGEGDYPGLTTILLAETRWIAVATPGLLGDGPVDLATLPWTFVPSLEWERALIREAGFDPDALRNINLGNPAQQVDMARQGFCVAISTEFIVREDVAAGRLRGFELPTMPPVSYWAVLPPGPRRPAVDLFVGWLKKTFAEDAPPAVPRGLDAIPA